MVLTLEQATLAIIVGMVAAIIFGLKVLFRLERRLLSIDGNIEKMVGQVYAGERRIEQKMRGAKKSVKKSKKRRR